MYCPDLPQFKYTRGSFPDEFSLPKFPDFRKLKFKLKLELKIKLSLKLKPIDFDIKRRACQALTAALDTAISRADSGLSAASSLLSSNVLDLQAPRLNIISGNLPNVPGDLVE